MVLEATAASERLNIFGLSFLEELMDEKKHRLISRPN